MRISGRRAAALSEPRPPEDHHTWKPLVELPPGRKAIGAKWAFQEGPNGMRRVARSSTNTNVACCWSRNKDSASARSVDYHETLAPVVMKFSTLFAHPPS